LGKQVHAYLLKRGLQVKAFIDQNWQKIGPFNGTPVIAPDAPEAVKPGNLILYSVLSPYIVNAPVIKSLKGRGPADVWNMVDFVSAFPEEHVGWYWLATKAYMKSQRESYTNLAGLLADEKSRKLVEGIYAFRSTGDCSALPEPDPKEYFPGDIPRWKSPMRVIDCGAFTGDTLQGWIGDGYKIEQALAFEPDAGNFAKLVTALPGVNVINIPCGVARELSQLRFDDSMGMGSRMDDSGTKLIQCVSISEFAPDFAPTLIKMDIEGAEPDALLGAAALIKKYTPGLAIAIYHEPDHLWKIPMMIAGWNLGYKFYIRTHERNSFGTVLYAQKDPT